MKDLVMLVAYVRPARRAAVAQALRQVGAAGWSESDVVGAGHAAGGHGVKHVRFELLMTLHQAGECAVVIIEAAHTGADGDGLVVTLPVLAAQRISDRSVGADALRMRPVGKGQV